MTTTGGCLAEKETSIPILRAEQIARERQNLQLIDCRSPGEFAAGHIPGSVNIPIEELGARVNDIDTSRAVVFVCASGRRARAAAAALAASRASVAVLEGGVTAWIRSGGEVVRSGSSMWSIERQVRLVAGSIVTIGAIASVFDPRWIALPAMVGLGLTFAAVTDSCAMGRLLMRMPWNRRRP